MRKYWYIQYTLGKSVKHEATIDNSHIVNIRAQYEKFHNIKNGFELTKLCNFVNKEYYYYYIVYKN